MDGQLFTTLLFIAVAVAYLAGSTLYRMVHQHPGCGSACGGCKQPTDVTMGLQQDISIKLRQTRGR